MATFGRSDDLQGAEFVHANLRGARFVQSDLSDIVMRGVSVSGADIDSPWFFDRGSSLHVNGVDVRPFVEAELNRRFPGRADRRAEDPEALRCCRGGALRGHCDRCAHRRRTPDGSPPGLDG